jgi:hypothetical protein
MEEVWEEAEVYNIDRPFGTETAYCWRQKVKPPGAAFIMTMGMFIFLTVADDNWYPSYVTGGNNWEYDKPEIYFDVNFLLEDGLVHQTILATTRLLRALLRPPLTEQQLLRITG